MTASDIERAIARTWLPRQNLMIPNVSHGFVNWGECDILKVEKSGYLTEVEIKVTVGDLTREWKKKRWTYDWYLEAFRKTIRRYFIAVPDSLYGHATMVIPKWVGAGIMTVRDDPRAYAQTMVKAQTNRMAQKLTDKDIAALGRLGTLRYWDLSQAVDELQRQKGTK